MMVDVDTSPESAVDFVSVSASTQTQSTSIVCSKGSEKAVQCTFPKRGVPISCGNQCGTPIRDMVSAGVQCCAEDVHHTSVGTQCSFPAAEAEQPVAPTTAEVGTETDIITELPVQSTHRTSLNDESTDVKGLHIPSCSSLESSVSRTRKVNDESVAPVATTASPGSDDDEVAVPVVVVDDSAVPKGKKNKRKKHKSASRTPESSDRPVACNAAKSQAWTASTWPAVSPAMKLIRACVPVLMCSLAILLGGVWMGTYLGGAAEVDTYASAFPREASQSYGHMERQTRPPMWVAAGSSLTLGDVWAPRAEQGDVFEWFKDGKLLPGRTRLVILLPLLHVTCLRTQPLSCCCRFFHRLPRGSNGLRATSLVSRFYPPLESLFVCILVAVRQLISDHKHGWHRGRGYVLMLRCWSGWSAAHSTLGRGKYLSADIALKCLELLMRVGYWPELESHVRIEDYQLAVVLRPPSWILVELFRETVQNASGAVLTCGS